MKRFIAKYFIQIALDEMQTSCKNPPLQAWLRRWVENDPELQKLESDLVSLDHQLRKQSSALLASTDYENKSTNHAVSLISSGTGLSGGSPHFTKNIGWTSIWLAASVIGFIATLSWIRNSQQSPDSSFTMIEAHLPIDREHSTTKRVAAGLFDEQVSSSKAKQITDRLKLKGERATLAFAKANSVLIGDGPFQDVGRVGLKFIGQKLPAATVRMLGMNEKR